MVVNNLLEDDGASRVHGEARLGEHLEEGRERIAGLRLGRRPDGYGLAVASPGGRGRPGTGRRRWPAQAALRRDPTGRGLTRARERGKPGLLSDARGRFQAVECFPERDRLRHVQSDPLRLRSSPELVRPIITGKPV